MFLFSECFLILHLLYNIFTRTCELNNLFHSVKYDYEVNQRLSKQMDIKNTKNLVKKRSVIFFDEFSLESKKKITLERWFFGT